MIHPCPKQSSNMFFKNKPKNNAGNVIFKKYVKFRSSIYGRVVLVITILSVFLFVSFSLIFRSVNEEYLNTVIRQSGNNIGSIVEGALYHSMLENDKSSLQYTLDVINTLPGIDEVNMYDSDDELVYSSIASDTNNNHSNPNCVSCHNNIRSMFPDKGKSYKILDVDNDCKMIQNDNSGRHLLIKSPILNEKSCYLSSCHAHKATDNLLGSLVIKIPLNDLDAAVAKSSTEFFLLAIFTTLFLFLFLIFFTSKRIKDPLNALIKVSIAVANGDKSTRVEIKPNHEYIKHLIELAKTFYYENLIAWKPPTTWTLIKK